MGGDDAGRLRRFDATQHASSNHVHRIDGDTALCASFVQARHFVMRDAETACATFFGFYTNRLVRSRDGWTRMRRRLSSTMSMMFTKLRT
jgi:ubiquinone biosynthesis protein UbiJ